MSRIQPQIIIDYVVSIIIMTFCAKVVIQKSRVLSATSELHEEIIAWESIAGAAFMLSSIYAKN